MGGNNLGTDVPHHRINNDIVFHGLVDAVRAMPGWPALNRIIHHPW